MEEKTKQSQHTLSQSKINIGATFTAASHTIHLLPGLQQTHHRESLQSPVCPQATLNWDLADGRGPGKWWRMVASRLQAASKQAHRGDYSIRRQRTLSESLWTSRQSQCDKGSSGGSMKRGCRLSLYLSSATESLIHPSVVAGQYRVVNSVALMLAAASQEVPLGWAWVGRIRRRCDDRGLEIEWLRPLSVRCGVISLQGWYRAISCECDTVR